MKKNFCVAVMALWLALPSAVAHAQERQIEKAPRAERDRGPMGTPGGPMGIPGMTGPGQRRMRMEFMRNNPKLAGLMMRIRGEELSKMGDVLRRYGERLEKEGVK